MTNETEKLTNDINTLTLIDPKSGCDWFRDLSGNDDNITYNDETGEYMSTLGTYEWWRDLVEDWQKATDRWHELLKLSTNDDHEKMLMAQEDLNGDIEDYPRYLENLCDEWEKIINAY